MATAPVVDLKPANYDYIARWHRIQEQIRELKNEEMDLRQEIIKNLFSADKVEGCETITLGNGWKLKAEKPLYYKVSSGSGMEALETLCDDNHLGTLCEDLFRWKPEVNVAVYKKAIPIAVSLMSDDLSFAFRKALAEVIAITPGTPSLELIAPKGD